MNTRLIVVLIFLPLLAQASPIDMTYGSLLGLLALFPIAMLLTWLILGGVLRALDKAFPSPQYKPNPFWDLGFLAFLTALIYSMAIYAIIHFNFDFAKGILMALFFEYFAVWLLLSFIVKKKLKVRNQLESNNQKPVDK